MEVKTSVGSVIALIDRPGSARPRGRHGRGRDLALCAVLATVLALAACAKESAGVDEAAPVDGLVVSVDRPLDANAIGLVTGLAAGAFEDAGLEVSIRETAESGEALREVAAGRADLAVTDGPEVILARDRGLDVIAIAAVADRPLASLMWLPRSRIRGPGDLRGRAVALADRPYLNEFLETILVRARVNPAAVRTLRSPEGLAAALFTGRADATLGGSRNIEGAALGERGQSPRAKTVDELGIPPYNEIVVAANAAVLEDEPLATTAELFLAALERGTEAAGADPTAAARDLREVRPDLVPSVAAATVEATLPIVDRDGSDRPFGAMDRGSWQEIIAWMRDHELIGSLPEAAEVATERFLPTGPPAGE